MYHGSGIRFGSIAAAALLTLFLSAGCSEIKGRLTGDGAKDAPTKDVRDDHDDHDHGEDGHDHADDDHSGHGEEGHPDHGEEHGHDEEDEHGEHAEHGSGIVHISPEKFEGLDIRLVPVHAGSVDSVLSLPAEIALDPDNEAHVVPRVPGIVKSVYVGIGDEVEEGQLLAVIESRDLAASKSEYLAALAMRELARTTFLREEKLWKDKITAEQDYLQAKAAYQAAQISVDTAEQALHALGLSEEEVAALPRAEDTSLTRYEISAPFRATVLERHIALGETVGNDDDIFYIAKLDPVWAMGRATERDIRRIRKGQRVAVQLDALPGEEFSGPIDYIGSVLDSKSRTVDVRVVLPNPEQWLRAGLFGQMLVFIDEHGHDEAILVPNDALQRTGDGAIVYKEIGPGEFESIAVTVLHASQSHTEVQGELAEGDRVAAGDLFILKSEAGKESMGGGHSH